MRLRSNPAINFSARIGRLNIQIEPLTNCGTSRYNYIKVIKISAALAGYLSKSIIVMPQLPRTLCCEEMRRQLAHTCEQHPDPFDCPDNLVVYIPKFDEYGLIIHDGGSSFSVIAYCPWCGVNLPESKRDSWFDEIESLGIDPDDDQLPDKYRSDSWWVGA